MEEVSEEVSELSLSEGREDSSEEELSEGSAGEIIICTELLSEELSETVGSFEHPVLKMSIMQSANGKILRKIILSPFLRRQT